MNVLRLTYRPEDEWHGELFATVESNGFCGHASAWFGIESLRKFCTLAGAFPIVEHEDQDLAGGYWEDNGGALKQCHLGLRFSPHDRLGSICVTTTLATPDEETADPHQTVIARFLVSYADLARFRASFAAMLDGRAEEATLEATPS